MNRVAIRALSLGVGTAWWIGCSIFLDVDGTQCQTDSDCVDRDLGAQCVEHVCTGQPRVACSTNTGCGEMTPLCMAGACESLADTFYCEPETPAAGPTIKYTFQVRDFVNRDEIPADITVRACRNSDVDCTDPVSIYHDTSGTGEIIIEAPNGLPVYFEVTGEGRLRADLFDTGSTSRPNVDRVLLNVMLPRAEYFETLNVMTMVDYDTQLEGVMFIQVLDCTGTPASGISFTKTAGKGRPFVFINHIPNANETVTQYDPVYDEAYGGFVGVSPGIVGVEAYWNSTLLANGATSFNVPMKAGTVTYVDLRLYSE